MVVLFVTMMGLYATKKAYDLSVQRGRHRRGKRGVWDFGMMKLRRDAEEEHQALADLFWQAGRERGLGWTGARRRSGSSLLA